MRLGAHLPLADLGGGLPTAGDLVGYATAARELGFATLSANDHLFWKRPWLDGPTALASVAAAAGDLTLATSLALPVVRHPVVVAKMLASLAALAQGPVVGGLGPGSSRVDLEAVGIPYDERWARFDEALRVVRALVHGEPTGPGRFYPSRGAAGPGAAAAAADLVRQLGVRPAAGGHGVGRGRLVRLGLQRHPGAVRRGPGPAGRAPARPPAGSPTRSPTPWRPPGCT